LERSKWEWLDPSKKWAFDLPLLGWGTLIVGFPRDDEVMKKYAGKLLRLVNKVACKGGGYGLDACLWSQAGGIGERRGLGSGYCVDPSEEIKLNKYYDDSLWDDRLPNNLMRVTPRKGSVTQECSAALSGRNAVSAARSGSGARPGEGSNVGDGFQNPRHVVLIGEVAR